MARLIAAAAALVLAWLSIFTPSTAAVIPANAPVAILGYDGHHAPTQFGHTNSERGPPATHGYDTEYEAVDLRSRGRFVPSPRYNRADHHLRRPPTDGVQFLPNGLDDTFRVIVPGGFPVGTRGQEFIRVIVAGDGRVINAFPVNVR